MTRRGPGIDERVLEGGVVAEVDPGRRVVGKRCGVVADGDCGCGGCSTVMLGVVGLEHKMARGGRPRWRIAAVLTDPAIVARSCCSAADGRGWETVADTRSGQGFAVYIQSGLESAVRSRPCESFWDSNIKI